VQCHFARRRRRLEQFGDPRRFAGMIDIGAVLVTAAAIAALLLALVRAWRGGRLLGPLRVAVVLPIALATAAVAGWQLSKAPFQLIGRSVRRVDSPEPWVALTLDDGPTAAHTGEVLDILEAEGVKATFFLVGERLAQDPALGRRIAEAGHELGNHSFSHPRMVGRSLDFLRDEIERTDVAIRATGYAGEISFRPPFGKRLVALPLLLRELDRTSVFWDVAPDSANAAVSSDTIVSEVLDRVRPGSIVLLHVLGDDRATSRAALPRVIGDLRARGFGFVTVTQLLHL
jgi:peptidoglycan/xylan/chitin deacetylase (PgdA/CDA1 family)